MTFRIVNLIKCCGGIASVPVAEFRAKHGTKEMAKAVIREDLDTIKKTWGSEMTLKIVTLKHG